MTQDMKITKRPYVAPVVEYDEYLAEEGFAGTTMSNREEFLETTDDDGQNMQGGSWFDLSV